MVHGLARGAQSTVPWLLVPDQTRWSAGSYPSGFRCKELKNFHRSARAGEGNRYPFSRDGHRSRSSIETSTAEKGEDKQLHDPITTTVPPYTSSAARDFA
uniref:Uncharacterized protein n=1 Tax=Agrobacterium fabrum TaxID=1176649 RepID=A0A2Z2PK19_9HYPH|nr:hypothetical protein [Agrobacterium fabrum]